ncbi:AmmeMemoRadiSam system radical SAM enzyme [Candidatus Falkowbacteria bacterium CG1_02_41_21]|uniref:AmmeMemoRadiSam system radical SAM enzyme n=1 Tax=Candidatus Falkowbacteria bacterium CG1_02_41_21 TaxID=1805147 RepID=A0A1J4TA68_9BACT|nr:MAG: AmmeMemoRadiSam system radical SAM enzyme [Candidatus Falkowbacteria bacterium CG1_02_41_21]
MKEAINYRNIGDRVECRTCHHFCRIPVGSTGLCGWRQNIGGKLYLLSYGRAAAAQIDPIEKKPLFHFLPGSSTYSFGTLGCNFRCANCQNYDLSQSRPSGKTEDSDKISWGIDLTPAEIVANALKAKCLSIAYTYNEPTVFLEYALDTMKLAKAQGLKNVWVSNGFMSPETLTLILPYLDAINIDIKSFDDEFYQTYCGARLKPILENCRHLVKAKIWLEITTLIIPTLSDQEELLSQIARFIKQELGEFVPWHISAFSGEISWKLKHLPETPVAAVKRAYAIGREEGLKYIYTGNIWEDGAANTFCPACSRIAIKRDGYDIKRLDRNGCCRNCGEKIEGLF